MNSFNRSVKFIQHGINMEKLKSESTGGMINIYVCSYESSLRGPFRRNEYRFEHNKDWIF